MTSQLRKKTLLMVIVEIVGILALGFYLFSLQTQMAIDNQKGDSLDKLAQVAALLEERAQGRQQAVDTYDAVYTAKAQSLALMAQNHLALTADTPQADATAAMEEVRRCLNVENALILDRQGNVVARAVDDGIDYTRSRYNQLRTVFTDGQPARAFEVTTGGLCMRYYGAPIDQDTMAVVVYDPQPLHTTLEQFYSLESALQGVSVGLDGFAFAVNRLDYTFSYYPDPDMMDRDALHQGIGAEQLYDGAFGWLTVAGQRLYCVVKAVDDNYIVCAVTQEEINASRDVTVTMMLLAFVVVITTVVAYAFVLKNDQLRSGAITQDSYRRVGPLYYDKSIGARLTPVAVMGLILILALSLYMQTLFVLSRQSMSNKSHLNAIEQTLEENESHVARLVSQYDQWYLNKCQIASYILEKNPQLVNRQFLAQLSQILRVDAIYALDARGRTVATNAPYWDFAVSQDPEHQSYAFNALLKGYQDELIQDIYADDVSGALNQYIGVTQRDEQGRVTGVVQICVAPQYLSHILENNRMDSVLAAVQVGTHGFAFAVDAQSHAFSYYPDSRLIGRDAATYGMTQFALKDGFSDYLTIDGQRYFASSLQKGENYIYVAIPEGELTRYRMPMALNSTLAGLICLVVIVLLLTLSRRAYLPQDGAHEERGGDMVDVVMPDGRVKKTRSALSRWTSVSVAWNQKTPGQKVFSLLGGMLAAAALVLAAMVAAGDRFLNENGILSYVLSGAWERSLNIFAITNALIILVMALVVSAIARRLLMYFAKAIGTRGETVCRLLDSFIKYFTLIAVLYYALALVGVDTATLLASAGILSLVVGLGSQSLIADILAGLFIVFEGEFRVGDIVTVGDWRGTVLEIGVRTTKIEGVGRNIKIISNRDINGVINMTKECSFASCTVGIEYGESLERVESVLNQEMPLMKKRLPAIIDGPFYKGVVELGNNSVNICLVAQCAEKDRIQLARDLNREVKLIFDKHNINIPFPQIVLNQPPVFDAVTKREKRTADTFVKEQKEASRQVEPQQQD